MIPYLTSLLSELSPAWFRTWVTDRRHRRLRQGEAASGGAGGVSREHPGAGQVRPTTRPHGPFNENNDRKRSKR